MGEAIVWDLAINDTDPQPLGVLNPTYAWSRAHAINDDLDAIVVGESGQGAPCWENCGQEPESAVRGFDTVLDDNPRLTEFVPVGGPMTCLPSTYLLDVNKTPSEGEALRVGYADNVVFTQACNVSNCTTESIPGGWFDNPAAPLFPGFLNHGSSVRGVNDQGYLVGWGVDVLPGCPPEALFWESVNDQSPVLLGGHMPPGQQGDPTLANRLSNEVEGVLRVAGANVHERRALVWKRSQDVWSVTDLNGAAAYRDAEFTQAHDVNDNGWVVGTGTLNGAAEVHVYLFKPVVPPDCPADVDGNGQVDFDDLLPILSLWGPCPPEDECLLDIDYSGDIGFSDVLLILDAWGPCDTGPAPTSVKTVIEGMGLTYPGDWHDFLERLQSGSVAEQDNCACWIDHYYYAHYLQTCFCSNNCPDVDPCGGTHF